MSEWMVKGLDGSTSMTATLGEVFEQVRKASKKEEKQAILKKHAGPGIYYLMKLAFNEPKWLVPDGTPPFKQDPGKAGLTPSHLLRELRKVYLFIEGGNSTLTQLRREQIFQQILSSIDATEVKLLVSVKDKTFARDFRCARSLVEETFPGLLELPLTLTFLKA